MAKALILRTCNADMTSYGGFVWPESGHVECPDWNPGKHCGNGLHGFLWGEGNASLASWEPDAKWLVAEVDADSVVDIGGKVKFPRANVVFCGDRGGATAYLAANGGFGRAIVGLILSGGDRSTLTGGDDSTLTGGDGSTLTGGDDSTLCVKHWDGKRCRLAVAYVGENGIKPETPYRWDGKQFVEVVKP